MKPKKKEQAEKELWSSEKKRRFEEDFDKAFEPYEKMGFEPMDDSSWVLLGLLFIALIPAIIGFFINLYLY